MDYKEMAPDDLLKEAQDRDIPDAERMTQDELIEALVADDNEDPTPPPKPYGRPTPPTKRPPVPAEQPGRLGPVEAPPPQGPVPTIQRVRR
jgi:hypothetical protein